MTWLKFIILAFFICSCNTIENPQKNKKDSSYSKEDESKNLNKDNLRIAKNFAETYTPNSTDSQRVVMLKNIPDSIVSAFKHLRISNKDANEKYLSLIFLKIYRSHLQCCHQSYEIRTEFSNTIDSLTDPLLYEYNKSTKQFDITKPIEFISSGIAYRWVDNNKRLLSYDKIANEYNKIKKEEARIAKGVF